MWRPLQSRLRDRARGKNDRGRFAPHSFHHREVSARIERIRLAHSLDHRMPDDLKSALNEFVRFAQTLRGDEKSEAQTFLDHFFRALGHEGVIEAGATFEFRVAKKPGSPQLELIKGNGAPSRSKGGK